MKELLGKDFFLGNDAACVLFHEHAKDMPVIDYHCHVSPSEIADDRQYSTITEAWLGGDHYKWRLMRWRGVDERFITGGASDYEKFAAYADALQYAPGNPLYHWTHMELQRYFGCNLPLGPDTADEVWRICNDRLGNGLTARGIIRQSNVDAICTTDDPADSLEAHKAIAGDDSFDTGVYPTFRPDKAFAVNKPGYAEYIRRLSEAGGTVIRTFDGLKEALASRLEHFVSYGCRLSDHGFDTVPWSAGQYDCDKLFSRAMGGEVLDVRETEAFQTAVMLFLGGQYAKHGITMQIHYGTLRSANPRMLKTLGPDTGYDAIGAYDSSRQLAAFLGSLESDGILPKTILYSANPGDNAVLSCLAGSFQEAGVCGKVQHGSAWWFNDTKSGIESHLTTLAEMSALGSFIGMLTDSRSFLSYTRHEYFRRILCGLLGGWIENGEFSSDMQPAAKIVKDISYNNIKQYLNLQPPTPNSQLSTPNSQLSTLNSQLSAPNSKPSKLKDCISGSVFGENLELYPASVRYAGGDMVAMAKGGSGDVLIASGTAGRQFEGRTYRNSGDEWTKAPLNGGNASVLRSMFPFTAPVRVLGQNLSIGMGDRLGIATPGHIRAIGLHSGGSRVCPVFAQQSPRELTLTRRSFSDVLDAASFAVFRDGFTQGYGADGDHLKNTEDIKKALSLGYTMITLDCSEHIRGDADSLGDPEIARICALPQEIEALYIGKTITLGGAGIGFTKEQLKRIFVKYGDAIEFACGIYESLIAPYRDRTDFEISLDETDGPTTPAEHFFVASELVRRGVSFETMAPRFCGEFQKGIDYIGDLRQFESELGVHAEIARCFGYKLSIHSGSDKFSVYDIISRRTGGRFHLKTSGTSWLVAMQLIAEKNPGLYRDVHRFALERFSEARSYYHITADITKIPDVDALSDSSLGSILTISEARQLIHITYGLILTCRREDGSYAFGDKLREAWAMHSDLYSDMLAEHLGRHLPKYTEQPSG